MTPSDASDDLDAWASDCEEPALRTTHSPPDPSPSAPPSNTNQLHTTSQERVLQAIDKLPPAVVQLLAEQLQGWQVFSADPQLSAEVDLAIAQGFQKARTAAVAGPAAGPRQQQRAAASGSSRPGGDRGSHSAQGVRGCSSAAAAPAAPAAAPTSSWLDASSGGSVAALAKRATRGAAPAPALTQAGVAGKQLKDATRQPSMSNQPAISLRQPGPQRHGATAAGPLPATTPVSLHAPASSSRQRMAKASHATQTVVHEVADTGSRPTPSEAVQLKVAILKQQAEQWAQATLAQAEQRLQAELEQRILALVDMRTQALSGSQALAHKVRDAIAVMEGVLAQVKEEEQQVEDTFQSCCDELRGELIALLADYRRHVASQAQARVIQQAGLALQ
ncbi:hypothetical protein V8C86DRAFT_2796658 [Haematococcus lacustris]